MFSVEELRNPILCGREDLRNPCQRRGPLSIEYWKQMPLQWWGQMNGDVTVISY